MLANQQKIPQKKVRNKTGGDANESRFGAFGRELREHKVIVVPSVNTNSCVKIEQGWNKQAVKANILRVSIGNIYAIVTREEMEQTLAYMAQGMEMVKYQPPVIN